MRQTQTKKTPGTHTVALLGFDGVAALDITGPYEVFSIPSYLGPDKTVPPYRIVLLADQPGPVRSASGLSLIADASWRNFHDKVDTLLVCGGPDMTTLQRDQKLLAWLRTMARRTRRIGSICTGAFLLAEAGLLNNRRATTHWREVKRLAQEYPSSTVEPDAIYVKDSHVYTSAGITAGMDLALALVEEDLGRDVALAVARMLVLFLKRPGGQSQFSTQLQAQAVEGKRLADLLSWLADHHHTPLTVEDMAAQAGLSPRTFARVFVAETGDTPALHLEKLRLEHAVRLLETTGTSLDMTAQACGFTGHEQLRRAFQRHKGITPQEYRQRFHTMEHQTGNS
ncbi:MAG: GlxA family transcriptional regulator [Nitrospira sp.]|nr:GlxA family transcriptional regulator [Nitrospira sp.]